MNTQPNRPNTAPPKPGLLVEDANAVEVTHSDGRQRIEKTPDRDARISEMNEQRGGVRPTHPARPG